MLTNRDDDYLICKHYYNHIDDVSAEYKDFITFEHKGNHYFAWVNDGKVVLRSEAYPDMERTIRGIKAIIKNRDIQDRYSVDSQHGVHFLCLWGGGKNNKHTGNMGAHNEIGRSCPAKTKEELFNLIRFKGDQFASAVTGYSTGSNAKGAAAATLATAAAAAPLASAAGGSAKKAKTTAASTTAAAAATSSTDSSGGGFKWWWLLPLLLIPLLFLWKGCGGDDAKTAAVGVDKKETPATIEKADANIKSDMNTEQDVTNVAAQEKADAAAKLKAEAAAAKAKADAKAMEDARAKAKADAAAKAKREADRKAKTGGSVSQENITIGNKNSGF